MKWFFSFKLVVAPPKSGILVSSFLEARIIGVFLAFFSITRVFIRRAYF